MKSRALSLATVTILAGLLGLGAARAENLEAGKPPAKIFAETCSACHKSSRGLLKTVPAISLPGFLRQHYTTSGDMASQLSAFLLSSGAADHVAETPKPGKKDAKPEAPKENPAAATAQGETAAQGKKGRQAARTDTEAKPGDLSSDGRDKSAKLGAKSKRGKKGAPAEGTVTQEPAKDQTKPAAAETAKSETAKSETAKSEEPKSEESKPDGTKPDAAKPATASAEPNSASEKSGSEKPAEPAAPSAAASASPAERTSPQESKPADTKAREASLPLPPPAAPTSNPRPAQRPMLTLPGFPPPVADTPAEAAPAATGGAQPPASAVPAPTDKPDEQKSAAAPEPPKLDGASPAKPNAAKSVADQAAESAAAADSPKLDIIQEESHGPGQTPPPKSGAPRKKRAPER